MRQRPRELFRGPLDGARTRARLDCRAIARRPADRSRIRKPWGSRRSDQAAASPQHGAGRELRSGGWDRGSSSCGQRTFRPRLAAPLRSFALRILTIQVDKSDQSRNRACWDSASKVNTSRAQNRCTQRVPHFDGSVLSLSFAETPYERPEDCSGTTGTWLIPSVAGAAPGRQPELGLLQELDIASSGSPARGCVPRAVGNSPFQPEGTSKERLRFCFSELAIRLDT